MSALLDEILDDIFSETGIKIDEAAKKWFPNDVLTQAKVAADLAAASVGKSHPDYAIRLNNLAGVLREQGQYAEAEVLLREALAIDAKTIGLEHPDYATRLNNLAGLLRAQGQDAEAEALYREALAILEESLGKDHPNTIQARKNLDTLLANSNP